MSNSINLDSICNSSNTLTHGRFGEWSHKVFNVIRERKGSSTVPHNWKAGCLGKVGCSGWTMKKSGFQGIQLGKKRSEALLDFSVEVLVRLGMQFWGSFPVVAMGRVDLLLVK